MPQMRVSVNILKRGTTLMVLFQVPDASRLALESLWWGPSVDGADRSVSLKVCGE